MFFVSFKSCFLFRFLPLLHIFWVNLTFCVSLIVLHIATKYYGWPIPGVCKALVGSVQCSGAELNWSGQIWACGGVTGHARVITQQLVAEQRQKKNCTAIFALLTLHLHSLHTQISCNLMLFLKEMLFAVLSKLNVCFAITHLLVRGPMKGLVISCTVALEANNRPTLTFSFRSWSSALGQSDPFWGGVPKVGAGVIGPALLICGVKPVRRVVLSYKDTMLWKVPDGERGDTELFRTTWAASSSTVYR